jgi:hypothetical protein
MIVGRASTAQLVTDVAEDSTTLRELDGFLTAHGVHTPGRLPWLRSSVVAGLGEPWTVVVRDEHRRITGSAVLLLTCDAGLRVLRRPPAASSDSPFVASHSLPPAALARAIAELLDRLERPWSLQVSGLHELDPVAEALVSLVPGVRLTAGGCLHRTRAADAICRDSRRRIALGRRRLAADGGVATVSATGHPHGIRRAVAAVPVLRSTVSPGRLAKQISASALSAPIEATTLRVNDRIVACGLALAEPPVLRVLGVGSLDPACRYASSLQVAASIAARGAADERLDSIEWGHGSATGPPHRHATRVPTLCLTGGPRSVRSRIPMECAEAPCEP